MSIGLLDNLDIKNQKPNVNRDLFDTVADMMAWSENYLPDVFEANVKADGSRWRYMRSNTIVNPPTADEAGKWRKIDGAGGGGSSVLSKEFTSSVAIGQVKNGTKYPKGTPLETIIMDMLTVKVAPTVSFTITPTKEIYNVVTESLSSLTFNAKVTKGTDNIQSIKVYIDNVVVKEWTNSVSSGGNFSYTHTFNPATKKDPINLKITVEDVNKLAGQATKTIRFVGMTYFGMLEADSGEPTDALIKVMAHSQNSLKTTKGGKYTGITYAWGRVCLAYPKSFGALSKIMDEKNNLNYTADFTRTEIKIDNIDYYVYTINNPAAANNNELTFS